MFFNYNRLRAERIANGYTIQEMADFMGICKSTYSKKENGKRPISVEEFAIIFDKLNIPKSNISIFFTCRGD